jgi:hypothetical protein
LHITQKEQLPQAALIILYRASVAATFMVAKTQQA